MCDELLGFAHYPNMGRKEGITFLDAPGLVKIAARLSVCIINKKVIRERNVYGFNEIWYLCCKGYRG
jgi:hypothetical protein